MKKASEFPKIVHDVIEQAIIDVHFGSLTLIVQDARVVQIERTEKILLTAKGGNSTGSKKSAEGLKIVRSKILSEIAGLQYGQVLIKIQDGKIVQLEKTEKRRFPEVEGLYGDGI
ncbi:YezD family protein|uniref:YezD family protein n=1 Tax=Dendrosporobacter quercicolus TaxID=146817 RepID=UPI000B847FD6|nr:YezD family protein [Dendrosporobacter quercicolus]NSL48235.1 YezD family protein [Dendrosporobacter quercicolus DSM 1736]